MDALLASYGGNSSDSDSDKTAPPPKSPQPSTPPPPAATLLSPLPPPLLTRSTQRVRTFPHTTGNFAVHIYIPITLKSPQQRKPIIPFLTKIQSLLPNNTLNSIDLDIPLANIPNLDDVMKREFHISLARTVPLKIHQIDSLVGMLRQRLRIVNSFRIEFGNWDVLVNDEGTRCFLCFECVGGEGLREIVGLVKCVDEVYRLHGLPEFYEIPRPHISVAWAGGDVIERVRKVVVEEGRKLGGCKVEVRFAGVVCKIGKTCYDICKVRD